VQIVAFDKTGTLTTGVMRLQSVITAPGVTENEALGCAGAVEDGSEHPIGQAIAREAAARLGGLRPASDFVSLPGSGVRGVTDGRAVTVGSLDFFDRTSIPVPPELRRAVTAAEDAARIQRMGLRAALLTGDSERAARAVAAADLTLIGTDPHTIADALMLARVTLAVIRGNLVWAFGYNVVAIPMAVLGFLNPLIAGLAMSVSSLVVSGNSLQVRRFKAKRPVVPE
jgi:cation transport ATPase